MAPGWGTGSVRPHCRSHGTTHAQSHDRGTLLWSPSGDGPADNPTSAREDEMTEVTEPQTDESIQAAMQLIDRGLGDISERSIVTSSEVADLLLDVRSLLSRLDARVTTN